MPVWIGLVDESFAHADTSAGGAGSTTGVPTTPATGAANGWTDQSGTRYSISTNRLKLANSSGTWPKDGLSALYRNSAGEKAINQRVIVDWDTPESTIPSEKWLSVVGRFNAATGAGYAVTMRTNGNWYLWTKTASSGTGPTAGGSFALNLAHVNRVQVDFIATNSTTTTITVTITDLTTSATQTYTFTDTTAELQSAGSAGVTSTGASDGPFYVNRFQYFQGDVLTPGVPTVTGATRTTVSLSAPQGTGGTLPLTQSWYRGTNSNFVPPGQGTAFGGTSLTPTDTPGGSPGDVFYYRSCLTDSSTPTPAFAYSGVIAGATLKAGPSVGLIGDSRTANYATDATAHAAQKYVAAWKNLFPDYDFAVTNWGAASTDSAYWTTGRGNIQVAVSGIIAAGATWVVYMIGANDSRGTDFTSAATFQSNVSNAVNYMVSQGLKVQLDEAGYQVPNQPPGSLWTDQSPSLTVGYTAALDALCDGVNVFKGDRQSTRYLMNNAATVLVSDSVHNDMALTAPFSVAALGRNLGYLGATGGSGGGFRRTFFGGGF